MGAAGAIARAAGNQRAGGRCSGGAPAGAPEPSFAALSAHQGEWAGIDSRGRARHANAAARRGPGSEWAARHMTGRIPG